MNQARKRTGTKKVLSMILVLVMLLSLLSMAAFTLPTAASSDSAASNDDSFYRIVHLDCGRKYFSKDWIIALLNEMKADGYNQLQLAFGNDGLRFLLNDMSFEANGTTYSHSDVVSKVEAGNEAQNSSGDKRWLTQSEMDEIIAAAKEKGIEIVPLLNLPGHANAILDIVNDAYNASGSNNTLDVANSEAARSFGMAIFKKYVDYFAGKGCKFFNFGADEYANDASGTFSFSRLNSTQYATFVSFINSLAEYIKNKGMTPRAFNDGLYYNRQSASIDTKIQCCYWSSGWDTYPVASAKTIANKGHDMINTNGDYYYVLGKPDTFDSDYSSASNFSNAGFMGSTVDSPVGSMFCIWCDYPNAENEQTVAQKVRLPMRAMALRMQDKSITGMDESVVANGFNANGTLNAGSTVTPDTNTSTKDIYVAVNGTATETVSGTYSDPYTTGDTSIATVTTNATTTEKELKAVTSIESGKQYLLVNVNSGKALTDTANGSFLKLDGAKAVTNTADLWTITSAAAGANLYTVMSTSGKYLSVGNASASASEDNKSATCILTYDSTNACWDIADSSGKYHLNRYGGRLSEKAGGYTAGSTSDKGSRWEIYEITGGEQTTITFNGVAEGTTSVQIGGVTYTIHVIPEDLNNVTPLKLEYWITNAPIDSVTGADSESRDKVLKSEAYKVYFTNIAAKADGVASPDGVDVTRIAPANTSHDNRTVYYWRCRMLDTTLANNSTSKTQQQTADGGDDETMSGVGFTKIRYYGSSWQVFTENNEWVTVDTDKNQLIAYYLEYIKVSDEVESFAADWGNRGDGSKGGWLDTSNYCTLSMQVVYEDGTTNPTNTTASALQSKTIVYGYWNDKNGRGIGTILLDGQEYEIYKVTSETGAATASFSGYDATVTNFTWDNNETTVWQGDPSSSVSIHNDATGFSTEGANANLCWDENKEAILLRVYVRAKVTEDSLTVNYFDENNTSLPFYSYNIAVESGTTFSNQFTYVPGSANENGSLSNNTVVNIKGVTQTVNWQLEKMSEIGAQYRFGNYIFTNAIKETGNKVVNLYYKFNSEKTFVVDFGLPLHITKTDISEKLSQANIEGVTVGNSLYGTVRANDDFSIDYILNKTIDGSDRITVTYTGTKVSGESDSATYNLTIIPATSVYYEDSFASFTNADKSNGVNKKTDNGYWTTDGKTVTDAKQALEALGDQKNVYGYDGAYTKCNTFSMGSATKVTVDANTSKLGQSPTATFTFKGTGFDVISLTGNQSGTVMYTVTNTETGDSRTNIVNTYYGYKYENGQWVTTNSADPNALYQIPVIKENLPYGTYEVTISVLYGKYFNSTANEWYTFWLDAIRVYNPMGKDNETYKQDNEGYPQYIKLRDALVDNTAKKDGALFIDGGSTADISVYENYGPNNEVYLAKGQAITFTVPVDANIASIQIGAKAPDGSAAKMNVNGTETNISSATEMYYKIDTEGKNFTIANKGDGILSLTNLKITFKASGNTVTLSAPTAEEQTTAVKSVRALFAAPEQTFEPEHFTATWSRNVRKGGTATLTVKASADVKSITVNGEEITAYTTKTARSFWGSKETYHVFTYRVTNAATADYSVCAVNADGVASDPITATLTVRPSIRDWWNGIFDKWKH